MARKEASDDTDADTGTGFFAVVGSVLAAGFGVQSRRNRERDFTRGKARHFVVAGLVGTVVFVLVIWFGVQMLLRLAS